MELPPLADQPNWIWIGLACLVVFVALSLLISGWSMKLACRICGVDDIGFRYAVLIAIVSGAAGMAASLAVAFGFSEPSREIGFLASLIAMVAAIALLVRRDPFRALGIYVLHSILSTLAMLVIIVPMAIAAFFMVPATTMDQLSTATSESIDQTSWMAGLNGSQFGGESSDGLADSANEGSAPHGSEDSNLNELENAFYQPPTPRAIMPEGVEQNPIVK